MASGERGCRPLHVLRPTGAGDALVQHQPINRRLERDVGGRLRQCRDGRWTGSNTVRPGKGEVRPEGPSLAFPTDLGESIVEPRRESFQLLMALANVEPDRSRSTSWR